MANRDKLKQLLIDVFLLTPEEFSFSLLRSEIDTWDSLGVVSLAVGIQETFSYHMTPEEAASIKSIGDIIELLENNGIALHE